MIRTGGARITPVRRCARCGLVQPPANFCRTCGYPDPAPLPAGHLPRARTGFVASAFFAGLTLVAAGMLACVLVFIFASTGLHLRAIAIAVSAAVLPTGLYGALLLWMDRDEPESREARGLAFFWGAVISVFLALLLELVAQSSFYL